MDETALERLLQDMRRQLARLESVQDRQDERQDAINVAVARLEQVVHDRAASCPWRVEIDEGLRTARVNRDSITVLGGTVTEIKIKVAVIAAGGGAAGGLVVALVRWLMDIA